MHSRTALAAIAFALISVPASLVGARPGVARR